MSWYVPNCRVRREHSRLFGVFACAWVLLFVSGLSPGHTAEGAQPPCAGPLLPPLPETGASARIEAWSWQDLGEQWIPPNCLGWTKRKFAV
jgi:rubredoxin